MQVFTIYQLQLSRAELKSCSVHKMLTVHSVDVDVEYEYLNGRVGGV